MTDQNKFYVTLPALRKAGACVSGYNRLVRAVQGKEFSDADEARETYIRFSHKAPISIRSILDSNGLDDALWALRCIEGSDKDKDIRLFAVWCARKVEHLITDQHSKDALDVAERNANGQATDAELSEAWSAAWAAARAASRAASRVAAGAASSDASRDAARDADGAAAGAASRAAAGAASSDAAMDSAWAAAWAASRDAARDAAWDATRDAQKNRLIEMLESGRF